MENHYLFIVNPNAGNGKAGNDWVKIEKQLIKTSIHYKAVLTTYPGHALNIVSEELSLGYKIVVVVGGDGTLNEVINGIFSQDIIDTKEVKVGIIPVGTGNDWAKYYGIHTNIKKALGRIFNHKEEKQDIGKLKAYSGKEEKLHYFINIAGFGFDAEVVDSTNSMQERGNRAGIAYLFNLVRCLFRYKAHEVSLTIDEETIKRKLFSISVGIGKYSGGGMKQTPDAIIDDGYFDVTYYDDLSIIKVLRNISRLYNGKIKKANKVNCRRCKGIKVSNSDIIKCQIDGELVYGNYFEIEILKNSLTVLV